ncbi:MAG: dTMP kinase [Eubacteriales bacterium]
MQNVLKPRFIVLEGIDGCGKTTQLRRFSEALRTLGERVSLTCEPTGGEIGTLIRRCLRGEIAFDPRTVAALFAADRIEHITAPDGIKALLARGDTVVCDRYYFSSYAYQGADCTLERVMELNRDAAALLRPALTVFIDIPVEVSLERIARRGAPAELFERRERLCATRALYLEAFGRTKETENVAIVDGMGCEQDVTRRILAAAGR